MTKEYGYEQILEAINSVMKDEVYLRNPGINFLEKIPTDKKLLLIQRERLLLKLMSQGFRMADIAQKMNLSKRLVEEHKTRLYSKTDTNNSVSLLDYARRMGVDLN